MVEVQHVPIDDIHHHVYIFACISLERKRSLCQNEKLEATSDALFEPNQSLPRWDCDFYK